MPTRPIGTVGRTGTKGRLRNIEKLRGRFQIPTAQFKAWKTPALDLAAYPDARAVALAQSRLMAVARFAREVGKLKPEFGAYMPYSKFLEEGSGTLAHSKRARPGVLRAAIGVSTPRILNYMEQKFQQYILALAAVTEDTFGIANNPETVPSKMAGAFGQKAQSSYVRSASDSTVSTISSPYVDLFKADWERIINLTATQIARPHVNVQFGFHRASIRGYGDARTWSDIRKQQLEWMAIRAAMVATYGSRARMEEGEVQFTQGLFGETEAEPGSPLIKRMRYLRRKYGFKWGEA